MANLKNKLLTVSNVAELQWSFEDLFHVAEKFYLLIFFRIQTIRFS